MIRIEVKGHEEVQQQMRRVGFLYPRAAAVGLYRMGERIIRDAVRLVPVNTGELRDSAYVSLPNARSGRPAIDLGFGSEHAVQVHEETEVHHDDGSAKFLQKAVDGALKTFLPVYAGEVADAIKTNAQVSRGEFPPTPKSDEQRARQGTHVNSSRRAALRDAIRRRR